MSRKTSARNQAAADDKAVASSAGGLAPLMTSHSIEVRHGSVSQLPFPDGMFDLVTGVETHFWWPNLPGDMRGVFRVLKPGGTLILIAEIYKGANTVAAKLAEKYKGWICGIGRKPIAKF